MSEAGDKPMVPKLRFPEFEGEWDERNGGYAFENTRARGESGLPIFSVTLDRGLVRRSSLDRSIDSNAADATNLRAQRDDLVYNMMRMWQGAVGRAPEELMVSPAYVVLSPLPPTNSRFFESWFRRARSLYLLWAYSHGLTKDRLRLYFDDFARIPMVIPERGEQDRIAELFDAFEAKLKSLEARREALEAYKKSIMQRVFSQDLRFTHDDGSPFPDWEEKRLGDVCSSIRDGTHGTHPDDPEGGFWLLSAKNVSQGKLCFGIDDRRISEAEFERISKTFPLSRNDILLTIVGTIGRVAIFTGAPNIAFQRSVAFLRANGAMAGYLFQYFQGYSFQRDLKRRQVVSAQPGIYLGDLAKMKVDIPHPDEQQKIADFLATLDATIEAVAKQIDAMQRFKKGLLQQMFV